MTITHRTYEYDGPDGIFEGVIAWNSHLEQPRPGILIFPNALGQKDSDTDYARRIAGLGYTAFVADLYGRGRRTTRESPDMGLYMNALLATPDMMRARLMAAHDTLTSLTEVDPENTAAIGFCFGGRCALDLARSGADVKGVISLHGLLTRPAWSNAAILAKILVLHGWIDPLAPPTDVLALAAEMEGAGADWQLYAYGKTGHSFTDTGVNMPERGMFHQPDADRRSWRSTVHFLEEIFTETDIRP